MHLTRRYFLKMSGAMAVYLGVTPFELLGDEGGGILPVAQGKTLVVVFLRGGADGLSLVIPYADPFYSKLRTSIAIPVPGAGGPEAGRAIDLDGFFALHPRLAALVPWFDKGLALAAHAVGHGLNTRSHFEEQDVWETGVTGNTLSSDGWLNRHLQTSTGHGPVRAVSIGNTLPRILHGKASAYAIRGVDDLTLPDARTDRATLGAALEHAYKVNPEDHKGDARDLLSQTAGATLEGVEQLAALVGKEYAPAVPYPETDLGLKLREVARLIKAGVGLEIAEVDLDGWDTHQFQGNQEGALGNLAGTLGDALAAFLADLGDKAADVLVATLSDFGRTAAENGTQGTDHGWGNSLFLLGGPVERAAAGKAAGKKVVTSWPGLAPDQLHEERDLLHTTDFRDVLAELVRVHLGNANLEKILPSHEFKPVGLVG